MALAEAVRAKRLLEIQNNTYGFTSDFKLDANFIEYFKSLVDYREKHSSKGTWSNWDSAYKHLIKFAGEVVSFKEITADYVEQLRDHLQFDAEIKGGRKLSIVV